MVQQRSVALAIILSLITCGIYGIYWFIVMTNDVGKLSGDPSFTGGKHLLLTLVTCGIWSFIWSYQVGKQVAEAQRQRGLMVSDNSVLYLILSIVGLGVVTYALVQSDVNKLA
jgi:amino acid transporter